MLDIQRRVYIDTGIQQFLNILVPFRVAGTRNIRMGKFIDKNEGWAEAQCCIKVKLRKGNPAIFHHLPGNKSKPFKQRLCLRPSMGLNIPDLNVNSFRVPEVCCPEHLIGLADTRNIPEKDFQFAPVFCAFLVLHPCEEEIGVGTAFRCNYHKTGSPHTHQYEHHVDNLYPDEGSDNPPDPVENDVIPQGNLSGHRPIGHPVERERDQGDNNQGVEYHG